MLADARSVDAAALARKVKEAEVDRRARIDVSVIAGEGAPQKTVDALKELAASAGGTFRAVDAKALVNQPAGAVAANAPGTVPGVPGVPAVPTAPTVPAAAAPDNRMFVGSNDAGSVVFLCDASGSMLNKVATLKNELQNSIAALGPGQSFNVIFMQDQKCVALGRNAQVAATAENKRRAYAFLDNVTISGTTDPIPGLTLAFARHPQLLYLLTDGDFPDNKAVQTKVAELNRDRKTKVNTIAFVNKSDTDTEFLTLLEGIAKANGGVFRRVEEEKLSGAAK